MSKAAGLRHIYTAVEKGRGQKSGFRTVAHSEHLRQMVPSIQSLVDGFSAPDGNEPRCRQLLKVPESSAYALSTFTALGPMPDGRPGNYWAETIMVPDVWLERAGWDTAAAFAALEWLGPQAHLESPEELDPVALPDLEPGSLDRLAILSESVHEDRLVPLLRAVVQQSTGLKPLRILATLKTPQEALEKVVMYLPLLVHPALRTYMEGSKLRCLTLRTWSPPEPMTPAADLTGFPIIAADRLAMEGSDVIDLGGLVRAPAVRNRAGEAYVSWLKQVIQQERWDELEAAYQEDMPARLEAWYASFQQRLSSAPAASAGSQQQDPPPQVQPPATEAPAEAAEGAAVDAGAAGTAPERAVEELYVEARPSPRAVRERIGEVRDEAEGEAWQILEAHRGDFQARLDEYQASMKEAMEEAARALDAVNTAHVARVREDAAAASRARSRQDTLESTFGRRLDKLESNLEDLRRHIAQLSQQAPLPTTHGDLPETGVAIQASDSWRQREFFGSWPGWVKGRLGGLFSAREAESVQKIRWGHVLLTKAVPAVVLTLLVFFAIHRFLIGRLASDPVPDGPVAESVSEKKREARRQKLLEELQKRKNAAALLASVKDSESYAERANRLTLMVTLGQFQITRAGKVALLQKALGVGIDGGWGGGSRRVLQAGLDTCVQCLPEANRAAPGQQLLAWNSIAAHCFLRNYLEIKVGTCDAVSPWLTQRSWGEAEAGRALNLFRAAAAETTNQVLKQYLMTFDPAAGSAFEDALGRIESLSSQHAESFLDLAFSWVVQKPDERLPEKPTDRQLQKLEELLASLQDGEGDS